MSVRRRPLDGKSRSIRPPDRPSGTCVRSHGGSSREHVPVRVTFLGHAGLFVETRFGSVLCDPWFTPAYFGSWFPFPRNDRLDPERFARPDFLYVSHLHRDHFDPAFLARHVDKGARVLLPDFPAPFLRRELEALGLPPLRGDA